MSAVMDCCQRNRARAVASLANLPPFSPVLDRVLASISKEDCSFAQLSDLIEKDTVVAGNLLKVVNSALFGRRGTVNSVRHAVSLLGMTRLRNTVLAMSVARMWNGARSAPGWPAGHFNMHSVAVAFLTDMLAQKMPVAYAEGAFAAGLFHDIGQLMIATGCPDEWVEIDRKVKAGMDSRVAERESFGVSHELISADGLREWSLPEPIVSAVEHHHEFDPEPRNAAGEVRLSVVVYHAEIYAALRGLTLAPSIDLPTQGAEAAKIAFEPLGLGDQSLAVAEEFEAEFSVVSSFLN